MTLQNIFEKIESVSFEADLALASGPTLFELILEKNENIQRLQ